MASTVHANGSLSVFYRFASWLLSNATSFLPLLVFILSAIGVVCLESIFRRYSMKRNEIRLRGNTRICTWATW
jgi:hypothetical protein